MAIDFLLSYWMELVVLLAVSIGIAGGVCGALLRTWSLHSRVYSLEDRVAVIEGNLTREVKTRAAMERHKSKGPDIEELKLLGQAAQGAAPAKRYNWWENMSGAK